MRRIEWTYSALPIEAIMLAIAVPITVPATPNSEQTTPPSPRRLSSR